MPRLLFSRETARRHGACQKTQLKIFEDFKTSFTIDALVLGERTFRHREEENTLLANRSSDALLRTIESESAYTHFTFARLYTRFYNDPIRIMERCDMKTVEKHREVRMQMQIHCNRLRPVVSHRYFVRNVQASGNVVSRLNALESVAVTVSRFH